MKLAVTVWNQRIAPVFDSAGTALVFGMDDGARRARYVIGLSGRDLAERARVLRENGVDELVCGAISREAEELVRVEGIQVHPFVAGDVDQVVQAWIRNRLDREEFSMPGCACERRRRGQRRGRCRGMPSSYPQR